MNRKGDTAYEKNAFCIAGNIRWIIMDDTTFRVEIEKLLVDKEYWRKYGWMNNATANRIVVYELGRRIRKHPILWKLFFKLVG